MVIVSLEVDAVVSCYLYYIIVEAPTEVVGLSRQECSTKVSYKVASAIAVEPVWPASYVRHYLVD